MRITGLIFKIFNFIIILFILNSTAFAKSKINLAILNFSTKTSSQSYVNIVRNYFEIELYKMDAFNVLEREQIQEVYKSKKIDEYGCNDKSCGILLGKILSADYATIGSLEKKGDTFYIQIKVMSVKDGEFILSYSRIYNSIDETRKIVRDISMEFANDLLYGKKNIIKTENKLKNEEEKDKDKDEKRNRVVFTLYSGFIFSQPIARLYELVSSGFGCRLGFDANNIVKNFLIGFEVDYIEYFGKINFKDRCRIVPISVKFGYKFISRYNFYLFPSISFGTALVSLYQDTGNAFDMMENSTQYNWEAAIKFSFGMGYIINRKVDFNINIEYSTMYEQKGVVQYFVIYSGFMIKF